MIRIRVNEHKCVGAGQCVMAAPQIFDQREEDGVVVLLDETPAAEQHEAVREAALVCPAAAIHLVES